MSKTTHTHRGNCQACGRLQAANNEGGRALAHHGYTVEWGFFHGTCSGSKEAPLELDRDFLDATVRRLRLDAAAEKATTLATIKSVAVTVRAKKRGEKDSRVQMDQAEYEAHQRAEYERSRTAYLLTPGRVASMWDEARNRAVVMRHRRGDAMNEHADFLLALADRIHGQALVAVEPEPERISRFFASRGDAYAEQTRLQAEGWKVTVRRESYGRGANLTARKGGAA